MQMRNAANGSTGDTQSHRAKQRVWI